MAVSQRGAWDDWLRFFLYGVMIQSQDATRYVDALAAEDILHEITSQARNRVYRADAISYPISWASA